jgi:hypothetical protein
MTDEFDDLTGPLEDEMADVDFDVDFDCIIDPRPQEEVDAMVKNLWDQIWYYRFKVAEWQIKHKKMVIVEEETLEQRRGETRPRTISRAGWELWQESARRKAETLDPPYTGSLSDFEWGMLQGKMSALRWAGGEDWESTLDT